MVIDGSMTDDECVGDGYMDSDNATTELQMMAPFDDDGFMNDDG